MVTQMLLSVRRATVRWSLAAGRRRTLLYLVKIRPWLLLCRHSGTFGEMAASGGMRHLRRERSRR